MQPDPRPSAPLDALDDHLALALGAAGFGAWQWDLRSGRVVWDERLERIYGLAVGTFDGSIETYRALIHPDDRADAAAVADAARVEHRHYETEHRIVHSDGTVRWTHGWAQPLFENGELISYI